MTEKKNDFFEQENLSQEDQMQLMSEEKFFQESFASLSCPPLPESLRAENIWNKICADGGDHQVTVELSAVEEQVGRTTNDETVSDTRTEFGTEKKMGKVLEFPKQQEKQGKVISLAQRRRRWAIACTLVLVVGLSTAYWKMKAPLEKVDTLLDNASVPQEAAMEEAVVEEEIPVEEEVEAIEEAQVPVPNQAAPQTFAAPTEDVPDVKMAKKSADELPEPASEEQTAEAAVQPETAVEEAEAVQPQVAMAQPQSEGQPSQEKTELQQKMLDSLTKEQTDQVSSNQQEKAESEKEDAKSLLQGAVKSAKQSQPQSYDLKSGSITYDPVSGTMTIQNVKGEQMASMQFASEAKVFAADQSMAVIEEDRQQGTVSIKLYQMEDLQNPQLVQKVTHQGELFDSYQSRGNSYTLVTSISFTKEQIEAGEYLPKVNGETVSEDKVNVIEGYGETDKANYNLTTTLTLDSVKTRVDLYLN